MLKKFLLPIVFLCVGYALLANDHFKIIAAGVAIFIVGMLFMEDGFKLFTGGVLEKILKKTTNTVIRAIFSGFVSTSIIQSSSLVSVIAISFLSAELIYLSQAIGIVFGANIGTTTTAWIVSAFGLKIKIAHYAMPMLVFGVIFTFLKNKSFKGLGYILLGLGFIFLGIGYMKDGFETLKDGINLASFAMEGYAGIAVYVLVGAVATVIIQSSSATMAIIITAVATGQIDYVNSLSLAIGANIGTTVTAVLGSLASNENGKRLAVAHFIFNFVTASFAVIFIYVLKDVVDYLAIHIGISDEDIAMKLSLFHTIFNVIGVLLVVPFTGVMVKFLNGLFVYKGDKRGKPKYLDMAVIEMAEPALSAIKKETEHLYDSASHIVIKALRLHRHEVWSRKDLRQVVETVKGEGINVDKIYEERIKNLYGEIIKYSNIAAKNMNEEERMTVYELNNINRQIIEVVKDMRELQKNIAHYMASKNEHIKTEYNFLRKRIAQIMRNINNLRINPDDISLITQIEIAKNEIKESDLVQIKRVGELVRDGKIDERMSSSLMNDSSFSHSIMRKLINVVITLWVKDEDMKAIEKGEF